MKEIIKSGAVLFSVVFTAVSMLVGINNLTAGKILKQQEKIIAAALSQVLPQSAEFSEEIKGQTINYYKGYDENKNINGYAFINSAKGYGGDIVVMTGIDKTYAITGVNIIRHSETPGLGSKINEVASSDTVFSLLMGKGKKEQDNTPWFCRRFFGKKQGQLFVGSGGIDAITGATISSKAVTDAVKVGILEFKKEI